MNAASIETVLAFALKSVWRASWQASILAALVLAIQSLFTRRLGGRGRYLLWSIVLFRLLFPVLPQSRLSVFNLSFKIDSVDAAKVSNFKSEISNSTVVLQPSSVLAEPSPQPSHRGQGEGVSGAVLWRGMLVVWLMGIVALSSRVMRECLRTSRLVRGLCEISDAQVQSIIESCAASLDLHKLPRAVSGEAIQTPAVVGFWRPVLLLPSHVLARCDRGQISMIVMHELAHLKRRDIAANWLVTIATVVHWFNPLVWLTAARIRADRELACDELVLSRAGSTGCNVQTYGNTLLALAELLSPAPAQRQLVGILESSAPLERRIRMIARFDPKASGRWAWPAVILAVLSVAFLTDGVSGQGRGQRSGAPTIAAPASQPAKGSAERATPVTDDEVASAMNRVLPEIRLNNIAFGDVMEFMRDVSGINIVVDWRALENAGIDRNAQITLNLRSVSVAQAFDHILRSIGGGATYQVKSGAIVVSVSSQASDQTLPPMAQVNNETVFYDVHDMMNVGADDPQMQALCDVIESTLDADMQYHNGSGARLIVKRFQTKLIITTTPEGQAEVRHILAKLGHNPSTQPDARPQ